MSLAVYIDRTVCDAHWQDYIGAIFGYLKDRNEAVVNKVAGVEVLKVSIAILLPKCLAGCRAVGLWWSVRLSVPGAGMMNHRAMMRPPPSQQRADRDVCMPGNAGGGRRQRPSRVRVNFSDA